MANGLPAGTVAINLVGNDANFQQTITNVNTSIRKFQKNVTNINGAMKMPGFQGWKAGFRDTMVTLAAMEHVISRVFSRISSAFKTAIHDMATFGDTYAKMSRRVGMGAKDLSLLGYAAEQSGASVSALGDGMKFLNRNLALAGQGSKAAQDAFAAIGINPNRLQALDKKEQFLQVADAIRRLGDEAKQTDAAMDWQAKFLQLQMENDQLQAKLETESEYATQMPDDLESVLMDMVKESTASSIPNIAYLAMILSDVFPNLGHIATYAHKESERIRKPAHKNVGVEWLMPNDCAIDGCPLPDTASGSVHC